MRTKLNFGMNFRSIAVFGIASAAMLFTACEKEEAAVLNPAQGVNSASSNNTSSALAQEYEAKLDEAVSILPLGAKPIDEVANTVERSLNGVFSAFGGDLSNLTIDTLVTEIPVSNGEVSFLNQQLWLTQSGAAVTNWVLANASNQIYGIDVIADLSNSPTVATISTVVLSANRVLNPSLLSLCTFTQPETFAEAGITLQRIHNLCEIGIVVGTILRIEPRTFMLFDPNDTYLDNYQVRDDLFFVGHPNNNGEFVLNIAPTGATGLTASRWNEYKDNLTPFLNAEAPDVPLSPFRDQWVPVVRSIIDPFSAQGIAQPGNPENPNDLIPPHHHLVDVDYILVRSI